MDAGGADGKRSTIETVRGAGAWLEFGVSNTRKPQYSALENEVRKRDEIRDDIQALPVTEQAAAWRTEWARQAQWHQQSDSAEAGSAITQTSTTQQAPSALVPGSSPDATGERTSRGLLSPSPLTVKSTEGQLPDTKAPVPRLRRWRRLKSPLKDSKDHMSCLHNF